MLLEGSSCNRWWENKTGVATVATPVFVQAGYSLLVSLLLLLLSEALVSVFSDGLVDFGLEVEDLARLSVT
jgi:hypothetical protein